MDWLIEMDWRTIFSFCAVAISAFVLARMLAADAVTAELFHDHNYSEEDRFLIRFDNPTRRSLLLNKVKLLEPLYDQVLIGPKDSDVRADLRRAYRDQGDSENLIGVYARIPPRDKAELEVSFQRKNTGFSCEFVWSTHLPKRVRWWLPRKLNYGADTLTNMRMAR